MIELLSKYSRQEHVFVPLTDIRADVEFVHVALKTSQSAERLAGEASMSSLDVLPGTGNKPPSHLQVNNPGFSELTQVVCFPQEDGRCSMTCVSMYSGTPVNAVTART